MCTYRVLLLCHRQDQCHLPALKTTSSLSLLHLLPLFWVGSPLHRFSLTPIRVGGTGSRTPTVLPQRPHSPFPSIPGSILVSDTVSLREPAQLKLQTAGEVDTETTFLLKTAAAQKTRHYTVPGLLKHIFKGICQKWPYFLFRSMNTY